jgi:hypothetical protein
LAIQTNSRHWVLLNTFDFYKGSESLIQVTLCAAFSSYALTAKGSEIHPGFVAAIVPVFLILCSSLEAQDSADPREYAESIFADLPGTLTCLLPVDSH